MELINPQRYLKLEVLADAVRHWKKAHEKTNDMMPCVGNIKWEESWVALGDAVDKVVDALETLDETKREGEND